MSDTSGAEPEQVEVPFVEILHSDIQRGTVLLMIDGLMSQLIALREIVARTDFEPEIRAERPCSVNKTGEHGPIEWDRADGEDLDTGMCRACGELVTR